MSINCYACIEINAHALVMVMVYLKERNMDSFFHPDLLGSQPCEGHFRQARSFSSTNSTVTNFSVLEMMDKISKIQLQNDIKYILLRNFEFPSIAQSSDSYYPTIDRNGQRIQNCTLLPDKDQMCNEIEMARLEAIEYAESLGVGLKSFDNICCNIELKSKTIISEETMSENSAPQEETRDPDIVVMFKNSDLKQYNEREVDQSKVNDSSLIVKVKNENGAEFFLKKYILCWLLSKTTSKLSSDRIIRVMGKTR